MPLSDLRRVLLVMLLLCASGWAGAAQPAPPASAASADKAAAAPPVAPALAAHRSLRLPLPDMGALPPPTTPQPFLGWPGAPAHTVVSRKPELPLYPCSMCHNLQKLNTTERTFKSAPPPDGAPHAGVLNHGKGQMWCLDCHLAKDREFLRTLKGEKLDFDESPRLCGQCHSARYRDWVFGGHGKRASVSWQGERQLFACTHCHNPHDPRIPLRAASKPPPLRAGLQPMAAVKHAVTPAWKNASPKGPPGGQTPKQ